MEETPVAAQRTGRTFQGRIGRIISGLACVAVLGLSTSAPAHASPVLCSPAGGGTIARSHQVRVFIRHSNFYSCWLPTRRRTLLGQIGASLPEQAATLSTRVRIDGQYVGFAIEGTAEGGEEGIAFAVNARTGRVKREVEAPQIDHEDGLLVSSVADVGVTADGSLVYEQVEGSPCPGFHAGQEHLPDVALIAVEPGSRHRVLDCELSTEPQGSISKLVVVGQTATWMHAGSARSATLR
jgi:hypothetical protein